ncbi:hypothetical protein J3E68DRAFT_320679 [Trichoderma sp. SZMC 28012]
MEPYDPTQYIHVPNLHTTLTAKRYLDLDEFDDSDNVASKRACFQPQHSIAGSSPASEGPQIHTIDTTFDIKCSVGMARMADILSFEDQMDTCSDETPCSIQEDIMPSKSSRTKLNV